MIWIQFIILLTMILIGSRMKGIGLGLMGIVGMLIFVFVFHMRPTEPPFDVMMIILCIVTTTAALQAAGGLEYLISVAERIIRNNPSRITIVAPLTSYVLCLFAGTSHIVYSLLPVIAEVATQKRIRPERPLSISVVASHIALTGSPMSAATAVLASTLAYPGAQVDIMMICIPASIIGVLAGALSAWKMGKELDNDPLFIEKLKDPAYTKSLEILSGSTKHNIKPGAKTAVGIFGIAIIVIVICGAFPHILPNLGAGESNFSINANGTLKTVTVIEIVTISAATAILFSTGTTVAGLARSSLFTFMAIAVVSVFGVVWMSSTFISAHQELIKTGLKDIVQPHPWLFAIVVFIMGALVFSQAGTTRIMMPLGIALGVANPHLIAIFPAVNSDFVLPGYPTLLAAINFDHTGSTKIRKYLINHSFIIPGTVTIAVAIAVGFLLSSILL